MNYKIIIDILDKNEISTNISNTLFNKLKNNNYDVLLLNNNLSIQEKINEINKYGTNTIVISNQMNNQNTSEIIYSLYYDNTLPILINNNLNNILNISKFYQLRYPLDTSQDYYEIIRNTPNAESIIIRYENISNDLVSNIVNNIYNAISDYINKENIYVVKSGDTLYSIARKFNVSVNDLIKANNLGNNNLSINQELIIPKQNNENNIEIEENKDLKKYTIKKGDTLYSIAKNFNVDVNGLIETNDLKNTTLSIGQILLIPNNNNITNQQYIVKKGDSLYQIAKNFNTTVNEIIELNNLNTTALSIGQVLLIPSNNNNNSNNNLKTYTVISGDSLYKIANKFNTTVNELIKLNKLNTTLLSIGQTLLIPD